VLHGLAPILASESFPTKFRYSGTGISYNLSGILGGMIAPSLLAGLIGQDVFQGWYFVPLVYAFYCVVAMLALLFIRESRDVNLRDLDQAEAALPITLGLQKTLPVQFGGVLGGPNT
jgi:MFS family permease